MKIIVLTILFLMLLQLTGLAQKEADTTKKRDRRVHFSIFYSPEYCYRRTYSKYVGFTNKYPQNAWQWSYLSEYEKPNYGCQIGGMAEIWCIKGLSVNSGLFYSNMGYRVDQADTVFSRFSVDGAPWEEYDYIDNMSVTYKYHFYSFSFGLSYKLVNKRVSVSPGLSTSFDWLFLYKKKVSVSDNQVYNDGLDLLWKRYEEHPIFLSLNVKIDIELKIKNKISTGISPHFRYIIKRFNRGERSEGVNSYGEYFHIYNAYYTPPEPDLYSIGLSVYLRY